MPNWAKMGFAMNPWASENLPATKRRKKRTAKAATKPRKRKRNGKAKRPARLVKGSAAAKAYMAKIRKRRRR